MATVASHLQSSVLDVGTAIKMPAAKSYHSWRTKSTVGFSVSQLSKEDVIKLEAVARIEQWWIGARNRKLFTVLKQAVCAAEHSLTSEVLRKISPNEAELLKDPTLQAKVKFRFGGSSFPPVVLFKIFTSLASRGGGVQYISGKKMIKPASQAAEDARTQMGNRLFYDQMLTDACHHHQLKITDEVDVTTVKDYMQYATNLDESPAYMGGRENTWRKINLDDLPRHSFLHSLVEFLEHAHLPGGISLQRLPQSLTHHPPTQAQQIDHIKVVASLSTQSVSSPRRPPPPSSQGSSRGPSRRSRQAQQRVERMKKAYGIKLPSTSSEEEARIERPPSVGDGDGSRHQEDLLSDDEIEMEDLEWDKEVCELYQWSKELSFDDIR